MIVFKCERVGCSSIHPYSPGLSHAVYDQLPATWVTYFSGRARDAEGYIFCSVECLKKHLGVGEPTQPLEQPQSKTHRFMLFDENAEAYEGVKWQSGYVSLDPGQFWPHTNKPQAVHYYSNWNEFKAAHDGCGVTWIDQEEVSTDAAS